MRSWGAFAAGLVVDAPHVLFAGRFLSEAVSRRAVWRGGYWRCVRAFLTCEGVLLWPGCPVVREKQKCEVLPSAQNTRRSWVSVSVCGNAENKYMVFRRTLVRDDAALRGGDGLGGKGGMVDLRYGADVALVCARMVQACFRESVAPSVFAGMSPLGVLMFLGLDGRCKGEPGADALAAGACGDVALNGVAA